MLQAFKVGAEVVVEVDAAKCRAELTKDGAEYETEMVGTVSQTSKTTCVAWL